MNKKIILTAIFFIGLIAFLEAQNISRGFRQLNRERFDRALGTFREVMADGDTYEKPAASYGLAMVYAEEKYQGHDLYQALNYSLKAVKLFEGLDPSGKDNARRIVNDQDMNALLESLDSRYVSILKMKPSRQQLEQYLEVFSGAPGQQEIRELRDNLAWEEAKGFNTIYAYERYIKKFPEAAYADSAKQAIVRLKYNKAIEQQDMLAIRDFIREHPRSDYAEKAGEWLENTEYERVIALNSVDYYDRFLKEFPQSEKAKEVRKLRNNKAFEMTAFLNTLEAYNAFIEKYPGAEQVKKATNTRDKLAFERAVNESTAQALQYFIRSYPGAAQQDKAQELLKQFSISPQLTSKQNEQEKIAGKRIEQIQQFADKNMEQLLRKSRYDETGRLLSQTNTEDGNTIKYVYTYKNGMPGYPTEKEVYQGDSLAVVKKYETDDNGNLLAIFNVCVSDTGCRNYKEVYLYNHQSHLVRKVKISENDTLEVVSVTTNAMGRITEEKGYNYQGGKALEYRRVFSYTPGWQLAEAVFRDGNNEVTEAITYTYENGRRMTKKKLTQDGSHRKEWKYNEQGKKVSATVIAVPDEIVIGMIYYKYDYY